MEIHSCYELAVLLLGNLPPQFTFFYPIMAFIIALLIVVSVVSFLSIPLLFFKR